MVLSTDFFLICFVFRRVFMIKKSIQDLLALQELDLRIRNLEIRYKTIPVERAKLVAEFDVVKKALAEAKNHVLKIEQGIRKIQADIKEEQDRQKSLLIKSASIKKASEYEAVMQAIESSKKRISDLETQEITAWDDLEKAKADAVKAEKRYKLVGRQAQTDVLELDALKKQILEEVKQKAEASRAAEKNVAQTVLAQYKRMLASGKGEPVSAIRAGGNCGNCGLKLPPQTLNYAARGDLVTCDSCSYFLYDPDAKL